MGSAEGRPDVLGSAAINLAVRPRAVPSPNLGYPVVSLDFFMRMPDIAVFPHLSRRPQAAAARIGGKGKACDWIQELNLEGARNPERFRQRLIFKFRFIFSRIFHRIRSCLSPL